MAAESTANRGQRFESGIMEANEATDNSAADVYLNDNFTGFSWN